jgi:hypothetical protein
VSAVGSHSEASGPGAASGAACQTFGFAGGRTWGYDHAMTKFTPVHPGNRIELPPDWAVEMGLEQYAALEKTSEGILVHPCSRTSWDGVFAHKLHAQVAAEALENLELSGDNVLL